MLILLRWILDPNGNDKCAHPSLGCWLWDDPYSSTNISLWSEWIKLPEHYHSPHPATTPDPMSG